MAKGLSAKLPLSLDADNTITLNKTYQEVAKQNLKNLLLTQPGERVMIPSFGIGIRKYLFELDNPLIHAEINSNIVQQVSQFLSYIEIRDISFNQDIEDRNYLRIRIVYRVIPLNLIDEITISKEDDDIAIID